MRSEIWKGENPTYFSKKQQIICPARFFGKEENVYRPDLSFFPENVFRFFLFSGEICQRSIFLSDRDQRFFRKPSTWCLCDRRTSLDISGAVKLVVLSQPGVRENPTPILNSALMKGEVICLIRCSLATPEPNTDSARQNELLNMAQFPKVEKFFQQQFKIQKSIRALVETLIAAPK